MEMRDVLVEKLWTHASFSCCAVVQIGYGHRCGYVQLPEDHPWHDRKEDEIPAAIHGGLSWAGKLPLHDLPGFLIGFDTLHMGDEPDPDYRSQTHKDLDAHFAQHFGRKPWSGHVWTTDEVVAETERLADQAALAAQMTGWDATDLEEG